MWFGVFWKVAVCQNRALTRAPELPYGAIGTEMRCACGGMGVGWWGVVYGGLVVWHVVWYGVVWCGVVWCGLVWYVVDCVVRCGRENGSLRELAPHESS